ncbi:uncharacterized protein LOC122668706 [Telopea speciosissima]|uniref:uncharacterized protein LOC122668706 n=1 Tax=Telopea speciosissima TaxID=54955 RepID=UPI001CC4E225|nr:uncharacterized protein LOC122668706 [Telopea speciosissima]
MQFVDGTLPRPTPPSPDVQLWDRCNFMVLSWLLNILSRTIADSVIYVESAAAMWKELEERFSRSNAPRAFHLKRAIATIHQGTDSLAVYYTRLKVLWDELSSYISVPSCSCGAQSQLHSAAQTERVYHLLMGLSDSYAAIRSQILTMDPLPDVHRAYYLILQEEQQRALTSSPNLPDAAAMAANRVTPRSDTPRQ